jgi:L-lactate dehydrogenase
MRGVGRELVLVDKNEARARAEADDLRHAVPFASPIAVHDGPAEALRDCRVVVLSAGVNQSPGETRLQLLARNAAIFRELVPEILRHAPEAVLVVATNPVDVLTHLTASMARERGIPEGRVLGSGTTLDTARFRSLLGEHLGIDPHHVHAHVVGEHGDSEVLTWSLARVAGMPLEDFARQRNVVFDDAIRKSIDERVRGAAYSIIAGKRATYYGIGSALARIVDVIVHDQRSMLTVCAPAAEVAGVRDVTLALPRLVGGEGVMETFPPPLSPDEEAQLRASAERIRAAIETL